MRIVIKIGTTLLTKEDNTLNKKYIESIANQLSYLKERGHEVILVSSGATTAGRSKLDPKKETKNIPFKQALAAIGQGLLLHTYKEAFLRHDITIAQLLLTNHDFLDRTKYLNILHTVELLLRYKILPILNENDVTSIKEFAIGENDMLSAQISAMFGADILIILTTVNGLYTGVPTKDPNAKFIPEVKEITEEIKELAKGPESKNSRGGMITKILASEFATQSGIPVIIAHGQKKDIIKRIIIDEEKDGTYFPTTVSKMESHKNWMRHQVKEDAAIVIDDGAKKALIKGKKSLLSPGVVEVVGRFSRGDIIFVQDQKENNIGLGQVNYGAAAIRKIKGCHTSEIPMILPKAYENEVINRDQLVIFEN